MWVVIATKVKNACLEKPENIAIAFNLSIKTAPPPFEPYYLMVLIDFCKVF